MAASLGSTQAKVVLLPDVSAPAEALHCNRHGKEIGLSAYAERLEALAAEAADRCTGCGKCFEVCPTAREIGLDAGEAKLRVGELSA
jgi:ferredoxin